MNSIDQLKVRPQRDDGATFKSTLVYVRLLNEVRQAHWVLARDVSPRHSLRFAARFASLERPCRLSSFGHQQSILSVLQWFCSTFFHHPSGTVVFCCYSVNSTNNVICRSDEDYWKPAWVNNCFKIRRSQLVLTLIKYTDTSSYLA